MVEDPEVASGAAATAAVLATMPVAMVVDTAAAMAVDTAAALVVTGLVWAVTEPVLEVMDQVWVATGPEAIPVLAALDLALGATEPVVTPVWADMEPA